MTDPKQVPEHLSAEERRCFERLRKVSLGPWEARSETRNTKTVMGLECAATGNNVELEKYDAEFVAHARLDVPTLLQTISELREGRDKYIRMFHYGTHGDDISFEYCPNGACVEARKLLQQAEEGKG